MTVNNKKLKILLVENEGGISRLVQLFLGESGYKAVKTVYDAASGYIAFKSFQPDLCILSINLNNKPGAGIELAEKIRAHSEEVPIIFLSENNTEEEYLLCRPLMPGNFLGRELSRLKLSQAIDAALLWTTAKISPPAINQLHPALEHLFFKIGDEYKSIAINSILYFYAADKHTFAKVGERHYPCNIQLKTLADTLRGTFARIHKTYLVNISQIDSIQLNTEVELKNKQKLPIGYAYRKSLAEQLLFLR